MGRRLNGAVLALGVCLAIGAEAKPRMMLRFDVGQTSTVEQWQTMKAALAENPGCCDEVWFSTGDAYPALDWHRRHAAIVATAMEDVRKMGIVPSLQVEGTIGHSDFYVPWQSVKDWTGWTGSTGVENKYCSCPRDRKFLAYIRGLARIYAELKFASIWLDDDLRFTNHRPATVGSLPGCWCATCLSQFNAETKGSWTRDALAQAVKAAPGGPLEQAWLEFSARGLAGVARAFAEEVRRISPTTMMAMQHAYHDQHVVVVKEVLKTLHEVMGTPVGSRPGGAEYYDVFPHEQVVKSQLSTRYIKKLGNPAYVGTWCPEIESWPRTYGSRSGQSVVIEAFSSLAYGMNAVSMLIMFEPSEKNALYSKTLLKPLSEANAVLQAYATANEGTVPAGFTYDFTEAGRLEYYLFSISGVPVLPGPGKELGALTKEDYELDVRKATSAVVQRKRDELDARAKGTPAVLKSPFVGVLVPRVTPCGELRTVALLNTRIDVQGPVTVALRGVPQAAKTAVWHELRKAPVSLPIERKDGQMTVTVPSVGAWNGGWIGFE